MRMDDSALRETRDALRKSMMRRLETDIRIPPLLVVAMAVLITVAMIAAVAVVVIEVFDSYDRYGGSDDIPSAYDIYNRPEIIVLWLTTLLGWGVLAKVSYDLVSRQTKHFDREKELRTAMSSLVDPYHDKWDGHNILPEKTERRRIPLFWFFVVIGSSITSLVFTLAVSYSVDSLTRLLLMILMIVLSIACYILELYMLCFLTKEMSDHHRRWYDFTLDVKRRLARSGYIAGHLHTPNPLPSRDNAVYVVVTIFFSPFIYYWWYATVKDGNLHFEEQARFENGLLKMLESNPRPQSSPPAVTAQV